MYILPINGVIGEDFKLGDLLMHLNAAKDQQIIKLVINSPGGYTDEADKMEEALKKEKKIYYSTNSGDVASAAVKLFLVSPKENRTFDTSKGVFLIHLPFLDPMDGGATGTSEEILQVANDMKKLENDIAKSYQSSTGTSSNILMGFMKENIPLTEDQIQSLGFATIITQTFKAVAYYKNSNKMNEEVDKKLGKMEAMLIKLTNLFKPKNIMLNDVNGVSIDFGQDINDPSMIAVGVNATVDGSPANGNFVMSDGTTYVFADGTLNEIVPPQDEEMRQLKEENEALKQKLTDKEVEFENFKNETTTQVTSMRNELLQFKNLFSNGDPDNTNTPGGQVNIVNRKPFKN